MLISIIGDDEQNKSNFIKSRKKDISLNDFYDLGQDYLKKDLIDLVRSVNLFSNYKIIYISPKLAEQIDFDANEINLIAKDEKNEIIADLSAINKNTKAYKLFVKNSKNYDFSKPKDYTHFNIVDAVTIYNDKSKAIKLINQVNNESDLYTLVSGFHNAVINWISMKNNNETWVKLHPFVKKKTIQSRFFNEKNYLDCLKKVLDLDYAFKNVNRPKKSIMIDFVLYF